MQTNQVEVHKDNDFIEELDAKMETEGPYSPWELFQMTYHAELTTMATAFNGLRSLDYLPHITFLPHQITSAQEVIENMSGRAILADEVGLGKTIEAGLILKEFMIRGLVKKALILVPASLVNQWVKELNEKFYIPAIAHRKNYAWEQYDVLVSSIDKAKRSPNQESITDIEYDFILIDEAHKLKNHKTQNYSFIRSLTKKYCLLLTATPVQNRLMDIFNLVSILKPGHLGNYDTFIEQYGKDRKKIKQDKYLKQLIQKVMIRNTRQHTELSNAKRNIETIWIDFKPEEKAVYEQLENITEDFSTFAKITLLRELCSSREACYLSLKKMAVDEKKTAYTESIIENIEQLPQHVKAEKAVEVIKQLGGEKVIIFTEYRATQLYLQWFLQQHDITSVPFRGGFNSGRKDWMRSLFENHAQVLIATEAGGEGINLQFCNHLINYDLPWNPMRLEQRIGRIHRYGQQKDVHIYNISIRQTFEEHIMNLLYEKINMFEQVVGHLDDILAELQLTDMETEIKNIFTDSASTGEAKIKLDNLSSVIKYKHESLDGEERQYGNS